MGYVHYDKFNLIFQMVDNINMDKVGKMKCVLDVGQRSTLFFNICSSPTQTTKKTIKIVLGAYGGRGLQVYGTIK